MTMEQLPIHHTETRRIPEEEGGGWVFTCQHCGYQALYRMEQGMPKLEILDLGDPQARHSNNQSPASNFDEWAACLMDFQEEALEGDVAPSAEDEQDWLTPELREQIEAILLRTGSL